MQTIDDDTQPHSLWSNPDPYSLSSKPGKNAPHPRMHVNVNSDHRGPRYPRYDLHHGPNLHRSHHLGQNHNGRHAQGHGRARHMSLPSKSTNPILPQVSSHVVRVSN